MAKYRIMSIFIKQKHLTIPSLRRQRKVVFVCLKLSKEGQGYTQKPCLGKTTSKQTRVCADVPIKKIHWSCDCC